MRSLRQGVACAFFMLSVSRIAEGEPSPTVDLRWGAPQSCPSQADVERDIARTIGGRPVGREPLHARVDVWRSEAGGWKGDLELSAGGQTTRREVHGDTCEAVESAVVIVIGLAAVHDAAPFSEPAPVAPASTPAPSPPPEAPRPLPFPSPSAPPVNPPVSPVAFEQVPVKPRATTRRVPLFIGASALLDVGSLPSATPGVEVFAGWKPAWWQLEVTAAYLGSAFVTLDAQASPPQGANVWLADVGARACGTWNVARLELGPCVGGNAAWIHATGENVHNPTPQTGNTVNASFGGRASWYLTRWAAVHLEGNLIAPFDRATVRIIGQATTYTTAAAAFRGGLGLDVHF
jgi:hypothetical protein